MFLEFLRTKIRLQFLFYCSRVIIPAKAFARDYVITGVGLSVCLFVCFHDN